MPVCPEPVCPAPVCSVATGVATAVTATSATIVNNTFACSGSGAVLTGVEFGTDPALMQRTSVTGANQSPFSVTLSPLTPGTTYYYRAFVDDGVKRFVGAIASFTTAAATVTVATGQAVSITPTTTAILNNSYSGVTGTVTSVGVEYATNPAMTGSQQTAGAVANPFAVALTGLTPATTYYYRAFITANGTRSVGAISSFTTVP